MKVEFGNAVTRLLWGGVTLLPVERAVLTALVRLLPDQLRDTVEAQLASCNLVQREVDGRALDFYCKVGGHVTRKGVGDLPIKEGVVPLLRIAFTVHGSAELLHATMTAVDRQLFCLNFSHDLRPSGRCAEIVVQDTTHSWRSGYRGDRGDSARGTAKRHT